MAAAVAPIAGSATTDQTYIWAARTFRCGRPFSACLQGRGRQSKPSETENFASLDGSLPFGKPAGGPPAGGTRLHGQAGAFYAERKLRQRHLSEAGAFYAEQSGWLLRRKCIRLWRDGRKPRAGYPALYSLHRITRSFVLGDVPGPNGFSSFAGTASHKGAASAPRREPSPR